MNPRLRRLLVEVVSEVFTDVHAIHEEHQKQLEKLPPETADIIDTDNQVDAGIWGDQDARPNIVHGSW